MGAALVVLSLFTGALGFVIDYLVLKLNFVIFTYVGLLIPSIYYIGQIYTKLEDKEKEHGQEKA